MMEIYKEPIQPEPKKRASIKRLYMELNAIVDRMLAKQDTGDSKELSRQCVSLCRAAIGAFAWEQDSESILKVVNYFNRYSQIIVDAGDFKSTEEFNILTYGPGLEGEEEVQKEKERLKREFLFKLYAKPGDEPPVTQIPKYEKAAFFQGLRNVSGYYREHYGK